MTFTPSIIHIGAPKTATTFLQEYYYGSLNEICYLGYSHNKRFGFDKHIKPLSYKNTAAITDDKIQEVRDYIDQKNPDNKTILISYEGFFDSINENHFRLANSCSNIKKVFPSSKIIFTFRKQDTYLESYYRDCVYKGYYTSAADFIGYQKDGSFADYDSWAENSLDVETLNWNGIIEYLDTLFGRENVLALPYELFKENPQHFTDLISSFIGASAVNLDFSQNPNATIVNKKYYPLALMRILNRFSNNNHNGLPILIQDPLKKILPEESHDESKLLRLLRFISRNLSLRTLTRVLSMVPQAEHNFISEEISSAILKKHKSENSQLSQRIGIDISKYGY